MQSGGKKEEGEHLLVRHAESGKEKSTQASEGPSNFIASQVHVCVCISVCVNVSACVGGNCEQSFDSRH